MNMTDVRKLVDRWLDERVEIDGTVNVLPGKGDDTFQAILASITKPDSEVVTSSYCTLGDFQECLKEQRDGGDGVVRPQWTTTGLQIGTDVPVADGSEIHTKTK